ncbi:M1 family aminopeptidase, partial [Candidatus Eisenbacteria bacterium]
EQFGPYQHRQVRIVEFPAYRLFAQSFPTMIPFSEGAGFLARMDSRDELDMVFNRTAHEVAHQWWAHQVVGADVQGATLMSESLSEYTALMVMEREYGAELMGRFLRYELDGYLRGRGQEANQEQPLAQVEDQTYIHYNKGCLVMYALKDYIGEEVLNRTLAHYVEQCAYQEPPYTNSTEFLSILREATPDSLAYLLEDMFTTITLFSNRVAQATYTPIENGRFAVQLDLEAHKLRADGTGVETEVALHDWIDVGIFGEHEVDGKQEPKVLYLKKHQFSTTKTTLEFTVSECPIRAGIDPYNKLIDRDADDNVRTVVSNDRAS